MIASPTARETLEKIANITKNRLDEIDDEYKRFWKNLVDLYIYLLKTKDDNVARHSMLYPYLFNSDDFVIAFKYPFYMMIMDPEIGDAVDMEFIFETFRLRSEVSRGRMTDQEAAKSYSEQLYARHTSKHMSAKQRKGAEKHFKECEKML